MSRPRLLATAVGALLLSGCALNPPPVSTANRPDITAGTVWHVHRDAAVGARYTLPGTPQESEQRQRGVVMRTHTSQIDADLWVGASTAPGLRLSKVADLRRFADGAAGAVGDQVRDPKVRRFRLVRHRGLPAADFAVSCTTPDRSKRCNWWVRVVAMPRGIVVLQTVGFAPKSDRQAARHARNLQRRQISGLRAG